MRDADDFFETEILLLVRRLRMDRRVERFPFAVIHHDAQLRRIHAAAQKQNQILVPRLAKLQNLQPQNRFQINKKYLLYSCRTG